MDKYMVKTTEEAQKNDPECPEFIKVDAVSMADVCGRFASVMEWAQKWPPENLQIIKRA